MYDEGYPASLQSVADDDEHVWRRCLSHAPHDLHCTAKYTHTIETKPHTHTHTTVRSIFSQIDLQRNHSHAPHDLLPAKYTRTKQHTTHTHTHATVRSIFSQIDLQRNHSHAPHDLLPAKYTRNRNKTHTHTHTTVRSIFSQIDLQLSDLHTQSFNMRNTPHDTHILQNLK